jgi:glycosyltransferase involved in cell wall biosynthesis
MRICYIALGKFPHVDPYLDHFSKRGHDVHFVALTPGHRRTVPTQEVGGDGALSRLCGKSTYIPAILRARKVVRLLCPDIVHAHYATSAGLAAYVCGIHPWVVTAHGTDVTLGVKSLIWRNLLRELFRKADCVNPVSDGLRQMVASLGIPAGKIETFTFGIDTQLFRFVERPLSNLPDPLRLVCTRWFEPVYDHATILRSMAILKARGIPFHLTLIGEGSIRPQIERLVGEVGIQDQVTFAGAVPNASLPEQLARHDIYLSASTRDGTSLSLLESMAVGLYPIVSDIPANSEWITPGQNGLLHKLEDPPSLADHIVSYVKSANRGREALLHNRQLVLSRGDRAGNMERMEQIYRKLIISRNATADSMSVPQGAR